MLSEFQQKQLWDDWLSAQIRAAYFGALVSRYQRNDRWIVGGSLFLASSATVALLAAVPEKYSLIRPMLTALAAILSLWALVAKNERNSIDCSDLHFRWNMLAMDYEALWANTGADDAAKRYAELRKRESELSKSSTSMPEDMKLLTAMQENVVMHHQRELVA